MGDPTVPFATSAPSMLIEMPMGSIAYRPSLIWVGFGNEGLLISENTIGSWVQLRIVVVSTTGVEFPAKVMAVTLEKNSRLTSRGLALVVLMVPPSLPP